MMNSYCVLGVYDVMTKFIERFGVQKDIAITVSVQSIHTLH